jgi:hypothetical protein
MRRRSKCRGSCAAAVKHRIWSESPIHLYTCWTDLIAVQFAQFTIQPCEHAGRPIDRAQCINDRSCPAAGSSASSGSQVYSSCVPQSYMPAHAARYISISIVVCADNSDHSHLFDLQESAESVIPQANTSATSLQLDDEWLMEYALEMDRLLPGGICHSLESSKLESYTVASCSDLIDRSLSTFLQCFICTVLNAFLIVNLMQYQWHAILCRALCDWTVPGRRWQTH